MCDLQKRNLVNFHYDMKEMRFLKKSRWESPKSKSASFGKEIYNTLKKKVRRVREPFSNFPFISHSNNNLDFDHHDSADFNNLSKVHFYDEPIVKVSPPTPLRKTSFTFSTDTFQHKDVIDEKKNNLDKKSILKLRSLIETRKNKALTEHASLDKINSGNKTICYRNTCPYHKNELDSQIFDDDFKNYLPKRIHSTLSNSKITTQNSVSKSSSGMLSSSSRKSGKKDNAIFKRFKSAASLKAEAESLTLQNSVNSSMKDDSNMEYEIEKKVASSSQKATRTPKLGKASLLASFAKTVSIPSSIETHESSDEDNPESDINFDFPAMNKYDSRTKEKLKSSKSVSKDYLRVPKLGFASLHPSFGKLLPIDSFSSEEEMITDNIIPKIFSEYSFEFDKPEKNLICQKSPIEYPSEMSSVSSSKIESKICEASQITSQNLNESESKKLVKLPRRKSYSTRYAYKALNRLTTVKNLKISPKEHESDEKSISESYSSSGSLDSGCRIRKNEKISLDFTAHKEIREKLKRIAQNYLGQNYAFPSERSEEIKTIMSTSRSTSGSSPVFQISQPKSKTWTRIPSIKMYPRKNANKCLPCLYKTFQEPQKLKRKLPLAILSSNVDDPFVVESESDTSSVSLPDLKTSDFESLVSVRECNFELSKSKEEPDHKSQIPQDNESSLSKNYSLSPKSTDLKKVSIKSGSVHSTDFSKPSTPSGQSSESEDARTHVTNETLNTSKYLAPCHAPLVWKPNLESLKALRFRKATSMQSRVSAISSKSDDESDLEDSLVEIQSPQVARKQDRKGFKTVTIQSPDSAKNHDKEADYESKNDLDQSLLKEKRKTLMRTKTVAGQIDTSKTEEERKSRFVRAKTSVDFTSKISESKKEYLNRGDSVEDIMIVEKNSEKIKHYSREKGKLSELSKEEQEVLKILEKCVEDEKLPEVILKELCDWYSIRVSETRKYDIDPDLKRALKISLNLLRLLTESKRYLNPDKFSSDLEFSSQQPPLCNSRQLRRVLPLKSYNMVAPILNMPLWNSKKMENKAVFVNDGNFKKEKKKRSSSFTSDLLVHPPSVKEPSSGGKDFNSEGLNPYARFLVKPRRKVVIWRPLNEEDLKGYNPDATLHKRATKITDKICHEFCEWLRGLSGTLERIDEEVLKDMFQIIFTSEACKSMQVIIKEFPTVPKSVALIRNSPNATELEMTRKELILDGKMEKKTKKTFAFGKALPKKLRFVPPKNQAATQWLSCKNVPQELETMDAVWNGITHLESVKGYVNWLKTNTNISDLEICKHDIQNTVSLSQFSQEALITQVDINEELKM